MECPKCGEEVDEVQTITTGGKRQRMCDDCADQLQEQAEIADEATSAMKSMMEYKGGRR